MSAVARPRCEAASGRTSRSRRAARACGGTVPAGVTLGALLERTVQDLGTRGVARCPVCAGEMTPVAGGHGCCRACGSTLA